MLSTTDGKRPIAKNIIMRNKWSYKPPDRERKKKTYTKKNHQEAKWHLTSQKQHQKLIENVEIEECLYNLRENYFQPIIPYQSNHQSSESWIRFSAHFFFFKLSMYRFSGSTGGCTSSKQKGKKGGSMESRK